MMVVVSAAAAGRACHYSSSCLPLLLQDYLVSLAGGCFLVGGYQSYNDHHYHYYYSQLSPQKFVIWFIADKAC